MYDRGEYYEGCICVNGVTDPNCAQCQPVTVQDLEAHIQVREFLKAREENKKSD